MKRGRGFDRTARVADLIQKALAPIIQHEMVDERFALVTITSVVVSRDLSFAKVYVSVLNDEADQVKEIIEALNHSAKPIRFSLAKAVEMRVIPELRFVFDDSTAHGFHINSLIDAAVKKSDKK